MEVIITLKHCCRIRVELYQAQREPPTNQVTLEAEAEGSQVQG
jgi:hypothetical protein